MTLFSKVGILKWNPANRKRYEDFGYVFTKWGNEFHVKIEHLTPTTRANVIVECDYCGDKIETNYKKYNSNLKRSLIQKDTCEKCVHEKIKETSLEKYGVDSPNKSNKVKDKKRKVSIERYGVENVSQIQAVKDKVKNTVLEKYGVDNVFQSEDVITKMKVTRYDNKSISTSKQQLYINSLLDGELNYPVGKCSIDIALIQEKIAIEYDGGGHRLHIKFNDMSQEEFDKREMKRQFFLINQGWKVLRIISRYDYLPDDEQILALISRGIEYLNDNHSWVKIDIDNKKIYGSNINELLEFRNLRKIKVI